MNKYLDKKFFNNNYQNENIHLEEMITYVLANIDDIDHSVNKVALLKAIKIINSFCVKYKLEKINVKDITVTSHRNKFIEALSDRLNKLYNNDELDYSHLFSLKEKIDDNDYTIIQDMINTLKIKIKECISDKEYQRRVLEKINELQTEIDNDINKLEIAKGKLITVVDMINYANDKALKPIANTAISVINAIRGAEAKNKGIDINHQITYKEEKEKIEDAEIL
jgi:cellulose synthase/poly-beta-1,6-N-acetylglucosamine synthase-like glycosyltransferase